MCVTWISLIPSPITKSSADSRRIGVIRNDSSPDTPLHVIELDIPKEPTDQKRLDLHQSLSINGVIICYDSSDEASFEPVEGLLRAFQPTNYHINHHS